MYILYSQIMGGDGWFAYLPVISGILWPITILKICRSNFILKFQKCHWLSVYGWKRYLQPVEHFCLNGLLGCKTLLFWAKGLGPLLVSIIINWLFGDNWPVRRYNLATYVAPSDAYVFCKRNMDGPKGWWRPPRFPRVSNLFRLDFLPPRISA